MKRSGLSLVETIVALGIVSLVIILVVNLYPSAMATLRHAERLGIADGLAHSLLEEQMARPFSQLTPGDSKDVDPQELEGITYKCRSEVFKYPDTDEKRLLGLRVTVEWSYGSHKRRIVRESLIHNLPP